MGYNFVCIEMKRNILLLSENNEVRNIVLQKEIYCIGKLCFTKFLIVTAEQYCTDMSMKISHLVHGSLVP